MHRNLLSIGELHIGPLLALGPPRPSCSIEPGIETQILVRSIAFRNPASAACLWLYRTRTGLSWRTVGESAEGLVAVGLVIVARWNPFLVIPIALLFGLGETSVLKLQAGGVAISPSLLATVPYIFAIIVVVVAQARGRRSAAMPADLTAIFRTR
jgi:ABC-type uncharacterized transport system permease subunit